MFEPAVVNLQAYRNGVLRTDFTVARDGAPLNLTGYLIEMQIRRAPGAPVVLASANTGGPNLEGSEITIKDAANGVFEVFVSNLDFQDIAIPEGDALTLAYDILFTVPVSFDLLPLIKGSFRIEPGVTIHVE